MRAQLRDVAGLAGSMQKAMSVLYDRLDYAAINEDLAAVYATHLDANELRALADFSETPRVRSIAKKQVACTVGTQLMLRRHLEEASRRVSSGEINAALPLDASADVAPPN